MSAGARLLLVAGLLALPLLAQAPRNQPSASTGSVDTLSSSPPDSLARATLGATTNPGATDTLSRPKSRADTVLVVKHHFDHREQIITGSVVMTCLALMMVVMNNYNPR